MSGSAKVISLPGRARAGVMVCLSSDPAGNARILLRKACQTAAELDADWYAVHVDCTLEDKSAPPDRDFRALLDSVVLAADMGAEQGPLASQGTKHRGHSGGGGEPEYPGDHRGQCCQRVVRLEGRCGHPKPRLSNIVVIEDRN